MASSDSNKESRIAVFRARQLLKEKRYTDALQVCTDELARGSNDLQLRLIAAHGLLAQGRHEGAKKEAQLVIRLDATQAEAYRILADVACSRNEMATACEHLERVLELDPADSKSRSLLDTLSRPSTIPLVDESADGEKTVSMPHGMQTKLRAASIDRFIENTVTLSEDDLEEDNGEAAAEDKDKDKDAAGGPEEAAADDDPPHRDPFSGELFQVTDSMIEELPSEAPAKTDSPIPVPGLKTEHDLPAPSALEGVPPTPPPSVEDDWRPSKQADAGAGSSVKHDRTLKLPALDELPEDDEAPTIPMLKPTAPPAPQLRLDPKASRPVTHEKISERPDLPFKAVVPRLDAAEEDDADFEEFNVEPASIPLSATGPQAIPDDAPDPVKARQQMARKKSRPGSATPDPLAMLTGEEPLDGDSDVDPSLPRSEVSVPGVAVAQADAADGLMGLMAGGSGPEAALPDVSYPDASGPSMAMGAGEMGDIDDQLERAAMTEPVSDGRGTWRWFLVAVIGLALGGGGLGGFLWYRSYTFVQQQWKSIRQGVHKSTPEGFRQARKAAERVIKHRKQAPKAAAALAMCDAAMSIEFGEDRLESAKQSLEKSKGTDSEWRTAAVAFLSLIDDPSRAVGYLQKGLEVYPKSGLLHYLKGRALAASGEPVRAGESYKQAIKLVPTYVAAKIGLAVLKGQEEDGYTEAAGALDTVLESNPNNLQALIARAKLRARHNKEVAGAADDARRITGELSEKAGPGQVGWAHLVLAQLARLQGQFNSMSSSLDEAIKNPTPIDAAFRFELAGELMKLYRMPDAYVQMKKALEIQPKNPEFLHRMGYVLLELDDPKEAASYIQSAPARLPRTRLLAGRLAYARGAYAKAADLLQRVLNENPKAVEASIYLALTRARQKKTASTAVILLDKLAAAHPANHRIRLAQAWVALWSANLDRMHKALKAAWKITKLDPLSQTLAGEMNMRKRDFPTAQKRYLRALRTRPDYRQARIGLALLYLRQGKLAEAKQQISEMAEVDRSKPDVHGLSARIALAEGDISAARSSIAKAEEAGASQALLSRLSGQLALAQGQIDVALQMLAKAVKLTSPKDPDLLALQGQAQMRAGKTDEGYDSFEKALDIDEGHPEALLELSKVAISDGEHGIAIRQLKRALGTIAQRGRPDRLKAQVFSTMGLAYLRQGDTGRAITYLQDAIELDASVAEPNHIMGLTFDRLDRPNRALPFYAKALELDPNHIETYERMGRAYAKLKDSANALRFYQEYLNRNPPASKAQRVSQAMERLKGR